jgi:hypothetical protein
MNLEEAKTIVEPWFTKTESQILDEFASLKNNSISIGENEFRSVFVPGTRRDRVLLVAHADTVFLDTPHLKVEYNDGLFKSGEKIRFLKEKTKLPVVGGIGIGADDRAGIALLWHLRNSGHSLLITNGEENGCLSSMMFMAQDDRAALINEHQFAIQFDRNGRDDLVFYDVSTDEFEDYCLIQTGYKKAEGSFTDIRVLCETICGVNISIGYKNEHSCNEVLNLRWWKRTAEIAERWLLTETSIPRFEH